MRKLFLKEKSSMKKIYHDKELENYEETQDSSKKNRLILGIVIVTAITVICLVTGCFSTLSIGSPTPPENKDDNKSIPPVKVDNIEFIETWNTKISKIKYASNLKIDFDKYKLREEPQKELTSYISFDKNKNISLKEQLEKSKFKLKYTPIISWIEMKFKVNYVKPEKEMQSNELMKYLAGKINPNKPFSNNTIDTVVQLNEFCYYFEKNKDNLYRKGYTRNIKSCKKIQEILDVGGIGYRVEK